MFSWYYYYYYYYYYYVNAGRTCIKYSLVRHLIHDIFSLKSSRDQGGRDKEFVMATGYGAEWAGFRVPVWARFSVLVQTESNAHPAYFSIGTRSLFLG